MGAWRKGRFAAMLLAAVVGACSVEGAGGTGPRVPEVSSVVVEPKDGVWSGTLTVGQTIALTATPRAADGSELPGHEASWSVGDTAVATVTAAGVVVGRGQGMTRVTATVKGKSGDVWVVVEAEPPPVGVVAKVGVSPGAAVLEVGEARQYTAKAFDAAGNEVTGRSVNWSTHSPDVVAITAQGVVHALAAGYGDVTAEIEGHSATVGLTVVLPEPPPDSTH